VPRLSGHASEPEEDLMTRPAIVKLAVFAGAAAFGLAAPGLGASAHADTSSSVPTQPRVGLVVQDGPSATPKFACVDHTTGMTGNDLLKAAKHKLSFDKSNFLSQIDGVPATVKPFDAKHPAYWSYWHLGTSGKWQFSSKGGDAAKPDAGTIDGWFYIDGASYTPAAVTFGQVCTAASPTPSQVVVTVNSKRSSNGSKTAVAVGVGAVVILGGAALVASRRKRTH
jgi:hypothetical protein